MEWRTKKFFLQRTCYLCEIILGVVLLYIYKSRISLPRVGKNLSSNPNLSKKTL
jgi:hypothetical protein